jgi:flagellar capping protein FliD
VNAANLASSLRNSLFSSVSITGLSGSFSQLSNLGITSNGYNNTVTLDSTALANALTSNLGDIKTLFTDPTNGLGAKLDSYLTDTIGDSGSLTAHQTALVAKSAAVDTQIANQEKTIAKDSAYWTAEFVAMETAQSQLTNELNSLNQQITKGTL